jgi:hypothetical protein
VQESSTVIADDRVLEVVDRHAGDQAVVVLDLQDPAGLERPEWAPGAHIETEIAGHRR